MTLKEMKIESDDEYHNYVNDCMAGHASVYHRRENGHNDTPTSPMPLFSSAQPAD